ncbi:MAG: DegV family protein [Actinomycetia bacterium]|nr:DegV family protein [Actinomycetes bacterium]
MTKIGIVADSTCDLTPQQYEDLDVVCLPTPVYIDGVTYLDPYELSPDQFYEMLVSSDTLPKTSQPSQMVMLEGFKRCAQQGCDHVLFITISSKMSGTYRSAQVIAPESPIPVTVIDAKTVSVGFGHIVAEAARVRDRGASIEELVAYVEAIIASHHTYCILDTLHYLVKGGRAGKTASLAASLLSIKPILQVSYEGEMLPVKKCRGRHRAMHDMARLVEQYVKKNGPIYYSLMYSSNPSLAFEFSNVLENLALSGTKLGLSVVGPAVGTYVAPEGVGISFYQRPRMPRM